MPMTWRRDRLQLASDWSLVPSRPIDLEMHFDHRFCTGAHLNDLPAQTSKLQEA